MIHNDVARLLADRHSAPSTTALRPLTRPLACEGPRPPADLRQRALVRALPARGLPPRVLLTPAPAPAAGSERLPSGT
ncbi:hypothetical protein OG500_18065 [Kitasatospora sp. NBC_01250]|uniref:hypothetical protein n=1 Tax=Kitasatospora sp. NBC_01250 TaxID=2903571 RepID=UPI002E3166EE|nr:hypothetical protein [Kitasatospora sp. NBC_01250]